MYDNSLRTCIYLYSLEMPWIVPVYKPLLTAKLYLYLCVHVYMHVSFMCPIVHIGITECFSCTHSHVCPFWCSKISSLISWVPNTGVYPAWNPIRIWSTSRKLFCQRYALPLYRFNIHRHYCFLPSYAAYIHCLRISSLPVHHSCDPGYVSAIIW